MSRTREGGPRAALGIGFSREKVIEAVMQTARYGGFPRALNALARFGETTSAKARWRECCQTVYPTGGEEPNRCHPPSPRTMSDFAVR